MSQTLDILLLCLSPSLQNTSCFIKVDNKNKKIYIFLAIVSSHFSLTIYFANFSGNKIKSSRFHWLHLSHYLPQRLHYLKLELALKHELLLIPYYHKLYSFTTKYRYLSTSIYICGIIKIMHFSLKLIYA